MTKNKIDFVLPWVDPSDLFWQKERNKYDKIYNKEDKENITRFRDLNTLKYVLRSIEKHCPWYHKIYLITTGHYPEWLDISHPKIELVTHEELFIDKNALPVFNSNAIEMNLINIRNLSEKFVYLNDDMLIWKALNSDRFFKNSKPIDFFYHGFIPRNKIYEILKGKNNWIDALNNNINLINNTLQTKSMNNKQYYHHTYSLKQKISNCLQINIYKKLFWINHWHHPQPYLKSTVQEVYNNYREEMLDTSRHKFRSSRDITPYLYRYWHLVSGNFEPYFHDDAIVIRLPSVKYLENICKEIDTYQDINFICFNDQINTLSNAEFKKLSNALSNYLNQKFPAKASFEK
jgi:hypothetical protein